MRQGKIVEVTIRYAGGYVVTNYPIGQTILIFDDASVFPESGGEVEIGQYIYPYISVDKTTNTMELSSGLQEIMDYGDKATLYPVVEEKWAAVLTSAPEETLPCRVPHALFDRITDGIRETNEREAVDIALDAKGWYIYDIIAKPPLIDGAYLNPDTVPTPGANVDPPAYAPAVSAYGAIGGVFLRSEPVANADPVEYEWHMLPDNVTLPTGGDSATLIVVGPESQFLVRYQPDGTTPFPYDADTWFRAFAKDKDGYGPVSEATSARPVQITAPDVGVGSITDTQIADGAITTPKIMAGAIDADKIAANAVSAAAIAAGAVTAEEIASGAVTADKINAGAVTADKIAALLLLASTIQVGGPNFTIDPTNGIQIQLANGGKISMPATGSNAEFRKVILDATDLLVEDNFELRGASNRISGTLKMSTGVDNPTTGPSLAASFAAAALTFPGSGGYRGLYDDGGTNWLTAISGGTSPSSDASIVRIAKSNGATSTVASAAALGIDNTKQQIIDYTRLGTDNYILVGPYAGSNKPYVVRMYNNAWAFVEEWGAPPIAGRTPVLIANDATDLFMGYKSNTGGDSSIQVLQMPVTGGNGRTNMVVNPSFEVDAANWGVSGYTSLTRSNTVGGQSGGWAGRLETLPQRTNLMPAPLANVAAYGITGWGAGGSGGVTLSSNGTALTVNMTGSGSNRVAYGTGPWCVVTPGQAYRISYDQTGYSSSDDNGNNTIGYITARTMYRWLNSSGVGISDVAFDYGVSVGRMSTAATAPAGAAYLQVFIGFVDQYSSISLENHATVAIRNVTVVINGESSSAFSGDSGAGFYWTGAVNNSVSVYQPDINIYAYSSLMPVGQALDYASSTYTKAGSAVRPVRAGIAWYDGSGTWISTTESASANNSAAAFTRASKVAQPPAGATQARLQVDIDSVARGEYHYIDAALFEQASAVDSYFDGSTVVAGQVHGWLGTANASASTEWVGSTLFTTATSGTPLSSTPNNLWIGTADLGAKKFVFNSPSGVGIWTPAGARTSTETDREWAQVAGQPTVGLNWDGTRFRALTFIGQGAGSFTNYIYQLGTAGIVPRSISARYSQYDSIASGGTHETAWSNPIALTLPARQLLSVTTPAPQGTGSIDEPDRIRHYIQVGGSGSYYRQADVTAAPWSATYDDIPLTGATAVSSPDFTGLGNPGLVQSAKLDAFGYPSWQLRGDGVIHMFVGEVKAMASIYAPLGTLKCDGTSYLRSIYPQLFEYLSFTRVTDAASHPSGINTIYIADTSSIAIGMQVEGAGIPNGSTVTAINANVSITINNNTTAAIAGATIRLIPHGAADSTHFNVPDYRGRTLVGVDGTPEFAGVGTKYGEKTHVLTVPEMPSHYHVQNLGGAWSTVNNVAGSGVIGNTNTSNTQSTGGGGPHNNIQPSAAVNWVIAW